MEIERIISTRVEVPGLGAKIKTARQHQPRSVEALSKDCGMSRANWYLIEKEQTKVLPESTLRKIEEVLGVDFGVTF
jgi:transcriptional regulator with XRE-family HTH domain